MAYATLKRVIRLKAELSRFPNLLSSGEDPDLNPILPQVLAADDDLSMVMLITERDRPKHSQNIRTFGGDHVP